MSDKSLKARKIVFDTALFGYSIFVICYAFFYLSVLLGLTKIELDQDFFLTQSSRMFTITLALLAAALLIAVLADVLKWRTVGWSLFASRTWPSPPLIHLLFVFAMSLVISLQITEASLFELLDQEGLQGAWRLWTGLAHPNFSLLAKSILEAIETIYIAFLATVIAIPIAFFLAFFCAKNLMAGPVARICYAILRLIFNVSRSVEPLIWALIFTVWVGVGPFAGMLALMVHSIASLTKYYSEIIEAVNEGPLDAVRSTGANRIQVVWFAVVPQIILPYIGMTIYRWDTNVRMATVIGLVGGGGIGTLLIQYQGQAMWSEVGCIILVIATIVWLMDVASAYIREALK